MQTDNDMKHKVRLAVMMRYGEIDCIAISLSVLNELADAALEAALSAQVQDVAGWQTMDTAPKDGTWVLLQGGDFSDEFGGSVSVASARWVQGNRLLSEGWLVCGAESGYSPFYYSSPTHWMPLPAAPAKQED